MEILIVLAVVLCLVAFVVSAYNKLIRYQKGVDEARSGIDVQMKEKGNLVKNLLAIIKKQESFESNTLKEIVLARQGLESSDTGEQLKASESLTTLVSVVMEQYPTLGTNESYAKFMAQYGEVERKVTYARNRYNVVVTEYNTLQCSVPYNFFAGMAKCKQEPVYELDRTEFKQIDDLDIGEM